MPLSDLIPAWQEQARRYLLRSLPPEERASVTVAAPVGSAYVEIIRYAKDTAWI